MLDNLIIVDKEKIVEEVNNLKMYGYRFAAITCAKEGDFYELTYHFDLNYNMKNLRTNVSLEDKIKSISGIFPSAFLMENEYQDLYGFKFDGLIIDYKGQLYLTPDGPKTPMVDKKS